MMRHQNPVDILTKPVVERIARSVAEGRLLRSVFGPHDYKLLAVADGLAPVLLLWDRSRERFAEKRSAAVVEWSRIKHRMSQSQAGGLSGPTRALAR